MVNKNKNKNKIILWDFNCTIDKMDSDGGNKTQKIYRWTSAYALSKLIADNKLRYLWRRENPGSTDFTHYDRSSGTWSRIDRAYTDIKVTSNTKINHISVSFTDHYHAIFFFFWRKLKTKIKVGKDSWKTKTRKLKLEKIHGTFMILFYGSPSSTQLQRIRLFY